MKTWQIKSLTLRVWLVFAAALVIFILIFGHIIYHVSSRNALQQLTDAHQLAFSGQAALTQWADSDIRQAVIVKTPSGRLNLQSSSHEPAGGYGRRQSRDSLQAIIGSQQLTADTQQLLGSSHSYQYLVSYLGQDGNRERYLLTYQPHAHRMILLPIAALILILLALGAAVAFVMARHIVQPLQELERYAHRIAHRQWGPPLPVTTPDEVGRLVAAMNQMQHQLKQREEEQQAFLQSISHDLKTPVAVIMGHGQAIADGVYIQSPEHTAEIIVDEAQRLEQKIKKILYYNTLDYTLENQKELETIDLAQLLADLADRFQPLSGAIQWSLSAQPLTVCGDREQLTVALENILDNSLRYAASSITITLTAQGPLAELTIANDGEPIPPDRLETIFDSLAKGKKGNFGLGLFITKKIITYYRGTIAAVNLAQGPCFIIRLPLTVDEI